jgi:hypothetical protein
VLVAAILLLNSIRKKGQISNKTFCGIICVLFVLITGLRGYDVGSDTTVYYYSFKGNANVSLTYVIAQNKRDIGYFILQWFIYHYTANFTVLTMLAAITFYVPISILIYEYSEDCGLSYFTLMAFTFFQFSMTGIRQTIALGFSILFLLEVLREKPHYIRAIIWVLLGVSMHRSCLMILLYLPIRMFKEKKQIAWVCMGLIPLIFIFRHRLATSALNIFNSVGFDLDSYGGSGGGGTTYFVFIILFLWGLFFTYTNKDKKRFEMPTMYLIMMGIATVLQNFVFVNSIFFRIVWYFSIFLIIYIPKMVCSSKITLQSTRIMNMVIYAGLLYMYLGITISTATVVPYHFFWQGV